MKEIFELQRHGLTSSLKRREQIMSKLWEEAKALFFEASELPVEQRDEFIQAKAKGNTELEALVMELMEGDQQSSQLHSASQVVSRQAQTILNESYFARIGDRLAGYQITGTLGEGAMGIVYLAEIERWILDKMPTITSGNISASHIVKQALLYIERGDTVFNENLPEGQVNFARAPLLKAKIYHNKKQYDDAIKLFTIAAEISQKAVASGHKFYGEAKVYLALCYGDMQQFELASQSKTESLSTFETLFGRNSAQYLSIENFLKEI